MLPSCHATILSYYHTTILPCNLRPYYHTTRLPCYHIALPPYCVTALLGRWGEGGKVGGKVKRWEGGGEGGGEGQWEGGWEGGEVGKWEGGW